MVEMLAVITASNNYSPNNRTALFTNIPNYLSLLALSIALGCTNNNSRITIKMETYYLVFDGIKLPENHMRRAFVEFPMEFSPPISYGKSVFVCFEISDNVLIPDHIDTTSQCDENTEPHLEMTYLGYNSDSMSGKFGIELEPISSFIHDKTAMEQGKAKIIEVEFFADENGTLEFVSLYVKNTIDKDPLFLK